MKALILAAAATITATAAFAAPMPVKEPPFIAKAIQGDMAEVMMGNLAMKQGATPGVRAYGKMLATDHGAHKVKAVALAKELKVVPPMAPSAEQTAAYAELKGKSGKDFDSAYVDHMIMDHNKDIAAYQDQAANGKQPVVNFAIKTLPTLKAHLAAAEKLKS